MSSELPRVHERGPDLSGLPTVAVRHDPSREQPLVAGGAADVDGLMLALSDDRAPTVAQVLAATATDAWIVLHAGSIAVEQYAQGTQPGSLHPLMSITKSVVGLITGILVDRGTVALDRAVTDYVPELRVSGYAGATVQQVLDMRSGVVFREDYADPTSHIRAMDAAIAGTPGAARGLQDFLCGIGADRPHGGLFDYRSCESDVLGWVCERATGLPMGEVASQLIWCPLGAEYDAALLTDTLGSAVHDGGLLAAARDVARLGQLVLDGGMVAGHPVLPVSWIAGLWQVSPDLRTAFAASAGGHFLPGGWYHNQWWALPGPHGDLLLGLGIHGQLLRIDPATRTVIVKLSSWTAAQDPQRLHDTLRMCDAVAAAVSGRTGATGPRFGPGAGRTSPVAGR